MILKQFGDAEEDTLVPNEVKVAVKVCTLEYLINMQHVLITECEQKNGSLVYKFTLF